MYPPLQRAADLGMVAKRSRAGSRHLSEAALPSQVTAVAQEELPEAALLVTWVRAQKHGEGTGGKEQRGTRGLDAHTAL